MINHNDSSERVSIDYETKLRCKKSTSAGAEEDEACCRDALPLSMTKWKSCQNPASVQGARINAKHTNLLLLNRDLILVNWQGIYLFLGH